jgi:hypothetical protein
MDGEKNLVVWREISFTSTSAMIKKALDDLGIRKVVKIKIDAIRLWTFHTFMIRHTR